MSNPGPYKFKNTVVFASDKTTKRKAYYNAEGGALNGNYTDFEVGCLIANDLGKKGYEYGKDFYFEDAGCEEVCFSVKDPKLVTYLSTRFDVVDLKESVHSI